MLTSINLDNDLALKTNKVQDIVLEGHLSPELETSKTPVAQQAPHLSGHVAFAVRSFASFLTPIGDVRDRAYPSPGSDFAALVLAALSHRGRGYYTRMGIST